MPIAIIVREEQTIGGETVEVKVYKTDGPLTKAKREQAEELDKLIETRMAETIEEVRDKGLLALVGRPGVLKLWWHVGRRLQFLAETDMIGPNDWKYVWRAVHDHAGPLLTGPMPERTKNRPKTSYFRYMSLLGTLEWDQVLALETWTTWCEVFDSRPIREDVRIVRWLGTVTERRGEQGLQEWIRPLNRGIRNELKNTDTSVLPEGELHERLESIYQRVHGE